MTSSLLLSKIISLSNARSRRQEKPCRPVADDHHEQRCELRRENNDRLFLQIVQSEEPDLVGTTISSNALDASANGLKVTTEQFIPQGCVIDLWVDDSARPGKFFLSSRVRWVQQDPSGNFRLGVELLDGAATDIQEWRERQA